MIDTKYGPARQFQADGLELAQNIAAGRFVGRTVVVNVTPGAGKSILYSMLSHALVDLDVCDFTIILVPRDGLRQQLVSTFQDPPDRQYAIVDNVRAASSGQVSMTGPVKGVVLTYQSLGSKRVVAALLRILKRSRVCLIGDEWHHLVERLGEHATDEDIRGAAWWATVRQIAELATLRVVASGTMFRHDGQPIPLVEYVDGQPVSHINYTRRDALAEKAIVPINFFRCDGKAVFADKTGVHDVTLSSVAKAKRGAALRTALVSVDYRDSIIVDRLREWVQYRNDVYKSQAIVVLDNQGAARHAVEIIKAKLPDIRVSLAISDEGAKGHAAISAFRSGATDLLVTVAMAHEGLDAKAATHLICLATIRSIPWIEQAFNRVTRFNPAAPIGWDDQFAYIYVPDDAEMRAIIDRLMNEQAPELAERAERARRGGHRVHPARTFVPISATETVTNYGTHDGCLSDAVSVAIRDVHARHPKTFSWSMIEKIHLAEDMGILARSREA